MPVALFKTFLLFGLGLVSSLSAQLIPSVTAIPTRCAPPPAVDLKRLGMAQIISVNFVGGGANNGIPQPMGAAETAGVVPASHWNNAPEATGSLTSLRDGSGKKTTASIHWQAANTWSTPLVDKPGNSRLMKGYLDTSQEDGIQVAVEGLPTTFRRHGYRVYAYFDGDEPSATRKALYRVEGQQQIGQDPAYSLFDGRFAHAWDKDGASRENFVVFRGLTRGAFTLTASPFDTTGTNLRAPLNALQIVAESKP